MKKLLLTLAVVAVSAVTVFSQGQVTFGNVASGNGVTINADPAFAAPGQGAPGAFVGATYSVQLLWAPQGTYADTAAFLAAVVGSSGSVAFYGTTGGGPGSDGAGLFDGGVVPTPAGTTMPAGAYTMAARAWFNGGTFNTFDLARAGGANFGYSQLFNINAVVFPATPATTTFAPFTVGVVPEPSTFALAGLGAAALLLFRRRK